MVRLKRIGISIEDALNDFLSNSTFRILTKSSISAITVLATLNDDYESPFMTLNTFKYRHDVTQIILKLMPSSETTTTKEVKITRTAYDGWIEVNTFHDIQKEIDTQKHIFRESLLDLFSPLDSICPSLIYAVNPQIMGAVNGFFNLENTNNDDLRLIQELLDLESNGLRISVICMEFLEGYSTAFDLLMQEDKSLVVSNDDDWKSWATTMVQYIDYEFIRLINLGFRHRDAHLGNIMLNPEEVYFGLPNHAGRCVIIDYGRIETVDHHVNSIKDIISLLPKTYHESLSAKNITVLQFNKLLNSRLNVILMRLNTLKTHYGDATNTNVPPLRMHNRHSKFIENMEYFRNYINRLVDYGLMTGGGLSNKNKNSPSHTFLHDEYSEIEYAKTFVADFMQDVQAANPEKLDIRTYIKDKFDTILKQVKKKKLPVIYNWLKEKLDNQSNVEAKKKTISHSPLQSMPVSNPIAVFSGGYSSKKNKIHKQHKQHKEHKKQKTKKQKFHKIIK